MYSGRMRALVLVAILIGLYSDTGATLCSRCETEEVRSLRVYYRNLNVSSKQAL